MPRNGDALKAEQIAAIESWIAAGAVWPAPPLAPETVALSPVVDDAAFLRRVYFDTVGVPPSEREARAFLADSSPDKRARLIERLLADEHWADHWVSYWQDVLAENPSMAARHVPLGQPDRVAFFASDRDLVTDQRDDCRLPFVILDHQLEHRAMCPRGKRYQSTLE
jgi:hypothetical protein